MSNELLANYTLQFSSLGNHHEYNTGSSAPAAIIFIADARQQIEIDPEVLKNAYGLTPAEIRVAIALVECATIQDVADQLEIGATTVRSHVKRIYAKLACRHAGALRQADDGGGEVQLEMGVP